MLEGISYTTTVRAKNGGIVCMVYSVHLPPAYENMNVKRRQLHGGDNVYVVVDNLRAFVDGPHVLTLDKLGNETI